MTRASRVRPFGAWAVSLSALSASTSEVRSVIVYSFRFDRWCAVVGQRRWVRSMAAVAGLDDQATIRQRASNSALPC